METPVPEQPKKVLPKPDSNKFQEELSAYKKLLEKLYDQKQDLIHEKKNSLNSKN